MPMRSPTGGGDPAITGILECGRLADGSLFVVSEFVSGESLATQLRRHSGLPLPNKALRIGRQLSALLSVAHGANIHHLALRPDKVLVVPAAAAQEGEQLKLLDLGLLTALGRPPTGEDVPAAALPYLAPEIRRGDLGVGAAADVFALAVMLYEIGSGGLPTSTRNSYPGLAGQDAQTGLMQMLPSWLQPFAELLDRMMAPLPGERPAMSQVAATLQQLSTLGPSASASSLPPPPSTATPRMAPQLGAVPASASSFRDLSGPAKVSGPIAAVAAAATGARPASDSQSTPREPAAPNAASTRTPSLPTTLAAPPAPPTSASSPPQAAAASRQPPGSDSAVTPKGGLLAELSGPIAVRRPTDEPAPQLAKIEARDGVPLLRDSQVTPTIPVAVQPPAAAPPADKTAEDNTAPVAVPIASVDEVTPVTPAATAPMAPAPVNPPAPSPAESPAAAPSPAAPVPTPIAAQKSARNQISLDGELAEMELSMIEEPTLSSEPTQAGNKAASLLKPADDVVEMNAEYTLNPQRSSERRDSLAFGVTHRSGDSHSATGSTGTGSGRTAATPVEPGLGGTAVLKVGQLVGNFRIVSKIGQGGMGAVYAAVHRQIGRRAAVKVLHGPLAKTSDYAQRFLNEARAVNILRHPNLVEIFDFGQLPDGTLYIIMEFLEGESLRAKLRRTRKLPEVQSIELARQMAQALDSAHQKGIIHRDLKPENVMLVSDAVRPTEDRVKILDFGIAKVNQQSPPNKQAPVPKSEDGEDFQTAIGTSMGTPKYMAPEQYADASKVDGKADVFALGVMLYEMVAGQVPFAKTSLSAFHQPPKPVAEVEPSVSPKLAALIHRMLTPKPLDRPGMREVLELLTPPATEVLAAVPAPPPPPTRWGRLVFLSALIAASIMAAGIYIGRTRNPQPPPPVDAPEEADFLTDVAGPKARALGVLYQGLRSADASLRGQAALMLGLSRDVTQRSSIATLLKDSNPMVQAQAAEALGQLGSTDAHGDLLALLEGNTPPAVRVTIAGALARLAHPRGKQVLHEMLQDPSDSIRITAMLLLLESGDNQVAEPLRGALKNPNLPDKVAWSILRRLAQIGDAQAQQQLSARMAGDGFTDRRITAAGYLAALGDERARALLSQAAQRPGQLQLVAASLLAEVGDFSVYPLFKRVSTDSRQVPEVRQLAFQGMGSCGRRHGAVLLAGILDELAALPTLRQQAAGAILQITGGDPAQIARQSMSWAQAALSHDDWLVRQNATNVLADLDSDQAVPLLARALSDSQREVRRSAATALGQKNLRAALAALRIALNDADPEVRQAGLRAMVNILASMGTAGARATSDETRARLQQLAESGTAEEQIIASATLARLGETAQLERLRSMLNSPNAILRRLVVETTAGDEGMLKQALSDTDFGVRFAAARRLGSLGQRDAVAVLKEGLAAGGADSLISYGLLRKLGEPAMPPAGLIDQIGRDTPTTRALLEIITDLPASDALPLLIKARFDSDGSVRRRVAEVATSLYLKNHDESLLQIVYSLSNDPDVSVRTRTGALLAKLMGKETAPKEPAEAPPDMATPVDAAVAPTVAARGRLHIVGEQWVRVAIDQQASIALGPPPHEISLSAGRHTVTFSGGSVEVTVPSGDTAVVQIPISHAEQLLHDTADAIVRRDFNRAQQLIDRARGLVGRGRGPRSAQAELLILQARLYEAQGRWPEAMTELERLQRLPESWRKPEQTLSMQAAIARLSSRLGRIRISKEVDGRCVYTDQWVLPGAHSIEPEPGGGQSRSVRVREGGMAEVKLCQGAVPAP
jgi:serine/threonine protein kinase